jgi:hypothetical protein
MSELDGLRRERDRWERRVKLLERRLYSIRCVVDGLGGGDFVDIVDRQIDWSLRTFGPGDRTAGTLAHIRKELDEIAADPGDLEEWCDVIILAIDGAWRATGATPEDINIALVEKQAKNRARTWPPIGSVPPGEPVEHVRDGE